MKLISLNENETLPENYTGMCRKIHKKTILGEDRSIGYYVDGKLHRESGPAYIFISEEMGKEYSRKEWYKDGKLHRLDGPAREWPSCDNEYWIEGISFHYRDYVKQLKEIRAFIAKSDNKVPDNFTGMAFFQPGFYYDKGYFRNGRLHCLDGPATTGNCILYAINGVVFSKENFSKIQPFLNLADENLW